MRRCVSLVFLAALAAGCGDGGTDPVTYGAPSLVQVNGVTKPTGMVGMTVILEGAELAEARFGDVSFLGSDGAPVAAATSDWSRSYIVATVPAGTATSSKVWVTTDWGTTDSLDFTLVSGNTFSPSNINWTRTADLPQALQGLGAAFVPVEYGEAKAKYVFTVGGAADVTNSATTAVFRGTVQESGAISAWDTGVTPLPSARAYHATAAATPYTAPIDTATAAFLYTIGGVDAAGTTVPTVLYAAVALDGTIGAWQSAADLPAAVHSGSAVVYRGYLYVVGGADGQNAPQASAYRAKVNANGSLQPWQAIAGLPVATAHHALVNFGPYLYVTGGDTSAVDPALNGSSGKETAASYLARIDMRDGSAPSWGSVASPGKARSKHGIMSAGGSVVITSGIYSGQAGSSENSYAEINPDGTLSSWGGATGSSTIQTVLGYSVYNQAAVSFVDATGTGHVVVLGGANRAATGRASAGVVYY